MFALSRRFSKATLLELAREVDAGFEVQVFVSMIGLLAHRRYADLSPSRVDVQKLRAFFAQWSAELKAELSLDGSG